MTEPWAKAAERRAGRRVVGIRRGGSRMACALLTILAGLGVSLRAARAAEPAPLRFGFAADAFVQVNENDARAALKVWAQTLGAERGIPVDPNLDILADTRAIKAALQAGRVDAVTMLTEQFWALRREVAFGSLILGRTRGETAEVYLLLVHRDLATARLGDLRGKSIAVMDGSRGSLAAVWAETLLLEENLGPADAFWGKSTRLSKLSRLVLPVFFKQVDACVVTRDGFRTLCELNPQLGLQLRVLAQSSAIVPTVFCFRDELVSAYRDRLVAEIGDVAGTVAGRQTLTLFQSEQLVARPMSDLDDSCALLDRHQRLLEERGKGKAPDFTDVAGQFGEKGSR